MKKKFTIIWLLLTICSFSLFATAQTSEHWQKEGDKLLAQFKKAEARTAYTNAYKLLPSPELLFKLSLTYSEDIKKENNQALPLLYKIMATKNTTPLLLAKTYTQMSYLYRRQYEYDSAKVYATKGIKLGTPLKYFEPLEKMTRFYMNKGEWTEASKYAYQALKEAEKTKDSLLLASLYLDLGDINDALGNSNKAFEYWQKTLDIEKSKPYSTLLGMIYEGFATYYANQSDEKKDSSQVLKAIDYYKKGLEADQKVNNVQGIAYQMVNLGDMYKNTNQLKLAQSYFDQAEPLFKKLEKSQEMGAFYLNYGDFLISTKKDIKKGIELFEKSNDIWKKTGRKYNQSISLDALVNSYELVGNHKKALEYARQLQKIEHEIAGEASQKEMQALNVKYETEKKDAQLLEQKLEIIQKQQRIAQIALAALMLLLLAVSGFMFYRHQQRRKIKQLETTFEQTTQQLQSFNYSVSHDLRHPIVIAQQALNSLKNSPLNVNQKEEAQTAIQSLNNMNDIIEAMLTLAAIERDSLNPKLINTTELITDIVDSFDTQPNIHLEPLPNVVADVQLLRQVFTNLISNAIKYSALNPEAKVQILSQQTAKSVKFEVKDNGLGFDERFNSKLFQLFGRLHTNIKGIGIGLVIVKKIIEKHGGTVWAKGQPNNGATFGFEIPQ